MALYRRGRIWYADYYADGVTFKKALVRQTGARRRKFLPFACQRFNEGFSSSRSTLLCRSSVKKYIEYAKAHKRWKRGRVDVNQSASAGVLWPIETQGHHAAEGRGIPPGAGQRCMHMFKHILRHG